MSDFDFDNFEKVLTALEGHFQKDKESVGAYKSEDSHGCHDSLFTTASTHCYACTYCSGSTHCTNCTHCHDCVGVSSSSYCRGSKYCSGCSYVTDSVHCHDCLFCVACFGLVKKEFHILNQPYKKDVFFKIVDKLEKRLKRKLR